MTRTPPLDWWNILLLAFVHAVALGGMALYWPLHGLAASTLIIAAALTLLTIFSISAGYHRLFSHRAYEAHPLLRGLLLAIGAGAFQNSALVWAADHRRHHARVDSDLDPYDARRGFWYAHLGWVLRKTDPAIRPPPVGDLERDPLVMAQHRYYVPVGIAAGIGVPVLLGFVFGDPWGGFIIVGAVRLMVVYHVTFAINSFAHFFGKQPFSDQSSARDNLVTAMLTMGEGYHNFHHTFPADYRNGVYAHQFDPTKWALWTLAKVGLARGLRRTPDSAIVRARLRVDEKRLATAGVHPSVRERLQQLRAAVERAAERWYELTQGGAKPERARPEVRLTAREMFRAYSRYCRLMRQARAAPGAR